MQHAPVTVDELLQQVVSVMPRTSTTYQTGSYLGRCTLTISVMDKTTCVAAEPWRVPKIRREHIVPSQLVLAIIYMTDKDRDDHIIFSL